MGKQLIENLKRQEAADVRANFKRKQKFSLESDQEIGEQLKALSYLLKNYDASVANFPPLFIGEEVFPTPTHCPK